MLITAIEVVDALDGRGPLGGEPGEHERGAGAEIRGHDRSPGKALDAAYDGCMPGKADIRAHADEYGIEADAFEKNDIHIHVPEGATPKDGPSAGITMATAILSAFTSRPVKRSIAMTGEITLRGKVLPIGGLKEKALAARRIGIRDVIIPAGNRKDVEEIPAEIRKEINFYPVETVREVFSRAIGNI